MPAQDRRIAKIVKENKKLSVSNHSLTSCFPSAPKQRDKMEENETMAKRKSTEDVEVGPGNSCKKFKDSNNFERNEDFHGQNDYLEGTEEYEVDDDDVIILQGSADISDKTEEYSQENGHLSSPDVEGHDKSKFHNENDNSHSTGENEAKSNTETDIEMTPTSAGTNKLVKYESVQRDAKTISEIVPTVDVGTVYDKILQVRNEGNRVEIVTNEILENLDRHEPEKMSVSESSGDKIFKDVAEVLVKCPNADPSKVYDLLEECKDEASRVDSVIGLLSGTSVGNVSSSSSGKSAVKVTSSEKNADLFSDPEFKSNPLYGDVKTLHRVMPDKDPNELYAYLEAHFDKPNRVQIVIDELAKSDSQESLPMVSKSNSFENVTNKGKGPLTAEDKLQTDLKELKVIFPDCDPNFLYEKLEEKTNDPERVGKIAYALFESNKYPKLSEILEKEKKEQTKRKYKKMDFVLSEFLTKFPEPFQFFADEDRTVTDNYKTHVLAYLKNTYPFVKDGFIKKVLEDHKYHLNPAILQIEVEMQDISVTPTGRRSKKLRTTPRTEELTYPEEPDELFFQELSFTQRRQEIRDHLDNVKRTREMKLEEARKNGELHECGCCFDDECLFEDMQACADGHIFCKECIRRSCEAAVGQGQTKFQCLTGSCEHQFPLSILQDILPASLFSLALRKMQEEEIQQANIPDLVTCPFCSFATIMSNPDDKVFKCLNPDCLKASCRLCKEPNHVPLRCNEIEKQGETSMRAYIENKMSEAMLRNCPRCKKRFYKDFGCNKMTCVCGNTMCYVCRESPIDYDHFNGGKCDDEDIVELHKREMKEAAERAKEQYLAEHPEAQDMDLKYDPVKLLEKYSKEGQPVYDGGSTDGESAYDDSDVSDASLSSEDSSDSNMSGVGVEFVYTDEEYFADVLY